MTTSMYARLATMMGVHLDRRLPVLFRPTGSIPAASVAVYVAMDDRHRVVYVGSVCRPLSKDGLAARLNEHGAAKRWHFVAFFPLKADTPSAVVRSLEGAVG